MVVWSLFQQFWKPFRVTNNLFSLWSFAFSGRQLYEVNNDLKNVTNLRICIIVSYKWKSSLHHIHGVSEDWTYSFEFVYCSWSFIYLFLNVRSISLWLSNKVAYPRGGSMWSGPTPSPHQNAGYFWTTCLTIKFMWLHDHKLLPKRNERVINL